MPNKPVDLYPEFYNDVFGPIMAPGSSSHMAAPCRAGYMCNSLLGGDEVAEIVVEMDNDGSFKGTFGTMNEDLGMLNGALGHMPDYADFFTVKAWLKAHNIPYRFDFCTMKESEHINSLKFILTGKSGKKATLVANSTGGVSDAYRMGNPKIIPSHDLNPHKAAILLRFALAKTNDPAEIKRIFEQY